MSTLRTNQIVDFTHLRGPRRGLIKAKDRTNWHRNTEVEFELTIRQLECVIFFLAEYYRTMVRIDPEKI